MDNSTSHIASEYDSKINNTIPYYTFFHKETLDIVKAYNHQPANWLDAGCGTGIMITQAISRFPDTRFTLTDPSPQMLNIAREKLSPVKKTDIEFLQTGTEELNFPEDRFDVITTIQSNHYFQPDLRKEAIRNCFRMLKQGGIYVTFENIRPNTEMGVKLGLTRWQEFQMEGGKSAQEAKDHVGRFGTEFFPITIEQHMELLRELGFSVAEILWASYMQAGFYAIK